MTVTSVADEQAAIMGHLLTAWTTSEGLITPIAWPNTAATPEVSHIQPFLNRQRAFNRAWTARQKDITHPGVLTVNVRVPLNQGDGAALRMAEDVASAFRNERIQNVQFRATTVREIGPEGPWYRVQVDCPYVRNSTHTHD